MGRGFGSGSGEVGWCYVCVSLDSLCRWQVQVSVYCARWIPAHLSFLSCICLWQISQIQTCLCVVIGPGFVSTSPAFMWSSGSHRAGPVNRPPIAGSGRFRHNLHCSL